MLLLLLLLVLILLLLLSLLTGAAGRGVERPMQQLLQQYIAIVNTL